VKPVKSVLKASGTKRLKLNCDDLVSSFAFNCNLRRYSKSPGSGRAAFGSKGPQRTGPGRGDSGGGELGGLGGIVGGGVSGGGGSRGRDRGGIDG